MAASATFALKAGVWFRRGRLLIVSPDSLGTACQLSGRNSTYRPVQILEAGSHPPVLASSNPLSTLHRRFACARLSQPCLPGSSSRRFRNAHHHGFSPQQLAVAWDQRPDRRTRRALLHLTYSCAPPCGPAILVTQDPKRAFGRRFRNGA